MSIFKVFIRTIYTIVLAFLLYINILTFIGALDSSILNNMFGTSIDGSFFEGKYFGFNSFINAVRDMPSLFSKETLNLVGTTLTTYNNVLETFENIKTQSSLDTFGGAVIDFCKFIAGAMTLILTSLLSFFQLAIYEIGEIFNFFTWLIHLFTGYYSIDLPETAYNTINSVIG